MYKIVLTQDDDIIMYEIWFYGYPPARDIEIYTQGWQNIDHVHRYQVQFAGESGHV